MDTGEPRRTYVPAAGRDWLLPFYDPFVKLVGAEAARKTLLDQSAIQSEFRILDVGCGTGSFAIVIKRLYPTVEVIGLDPDSKALARAKRKAERVSISIRLDQGSADQLPYKGGFFDRVFSTFMFHHIPTDKQEKVLSEVQRVLKPGGRLHMLDFAGSEAAGCGPFTRGFHLSHHLKDNSEERILTLMNRAGLASCQKLMESAMLFRSLQIKYYRADKG